MAEFRLLFEVMDKEPTLAQVWTRFLIMAVLGFIICRLWLKAALAVLPIVLLFAYSHFSELIDPQVGPDILAEAGYGYVLQSYVAMALALISPAIGALIKWRRSRKQTVAPTS